MVIRLEAGAPRSTSAELRFQISELRFPFEACWSSRFSVLCERREPFGLGTLKRELQRWPARSASVNAKSSSGVAFNHGLAGASPATDATFLRLKDEGIRLKCPRRRLRLQPCSVCLSPLSRCNQTARLSAKEKVRGANPRESANLIRPKDEGLRLKLFGHHTNRRLLKNKPPAFNLKPYLERRNP